MKCTQVQHKLLDYAEQMLDAKEHARIDDHLRACQECTRELADMKQTVGWLQAVSDPEPSEEFWTEFTSNVMLKVNQAKPPSRTWQFWSYPQPQMAMAFAMLLLFLGGLYVMYSADISEFFAPKQTVAELPEPEQRLETGPEQNRSNDPFETALQRIVSDDLRRHVLEEGDFALFDGATSLAADINYTDEMLFVLINSLTEEEKEALLSELHKMKEGRN